MVFRISFLPFLLYFIYEDHAKSTVKLVKVRAEADKANTRDFLVEVRVSSKATMWELPMLFDTGSNKFWVDLDPISSQKRIPRRGYILSPGAITFPDNSYITYVGGVSLRTTRRVKETVALKGLSRKLTVDLFLNEMPANNFDHTFGMVGVIGVSPRAQFTMALGTFYFVPGKSRMWMVVGKFQDAKKCHRPLTIAPLNMMGLQQDTWTITASVSVGNGHAAFDNQNVMLDTGSPVLELPQSLWEVFIGLISLGGGIVQPYHQTAYRIDHCDMSKLPSVTIRMPNFAHEILPKHYIEEFTNTGFANYCFIYARPIANGDRVVVGSQFLTHLISWWDAHKSQVGFCHITR